MSYEAICTAIKGHGSGIYNFGQSSFLKLVSENREGICRGVCTAWLIAKKNGNDYLKEIVNPTPSTSLLLTHKSAHNASDFQTEYMNSNDDTDDAPSEATLLGLKGGGLGTAGDKKSRSAQSFSSDAEAIGQMVLTSGYRHFILSIKGTLGGHSVAFFRPWVFFGKSSSCFFFDPNFGEFSLQQTEGIKLCLGAVATAYDQGLSKSYRLWGFN